MKKIYFLAFILFASFFGSSAFANVIFFEHANFQGESRAISSDWNCANELHWNDRISSIHIDDGWSVIVYEHEFSGQSMTLTSDWTVNNWDDFWNDRISSVRVIAPTEHLCDHGHGIDYTPSVIFYEHSNFTGNQERTSDSFTLYDGDWWNDQISSISIPFGWKVVIFEHSDFTGQHLTLTSDWTVENWDDFWNDRISSIQVIPPQNWQWEGY